MVRDERNSMGKSRRSGVVKMEKNCCKAKTTRITKQATKVPIVRPEFHAQVAPPKVRAITNDVYRPALRVAPTQSSCFILVRVGTPGWGWKVGMRKNAGAITPKMIKLM